jgi:hypothetical protein
MIEGQPAAHVMCTVVCSGAVATGMAHPPPGVGVPPVPIILGSPSVLIGGKPAARWIASGDIAACGSLLGDTMTVSTRTVFIGMGRPPLSPPVPTGLGEQVDRLVALSPVLREQMVDLLQKKWVFSWGKAGDGSYCVKTNPPRIVVDSAEKDNVVDVVQTLAHEVGHARYTVRPDYSSKENYVDSNLADEGAATLNNIKVQRDLKATGGPDIGIAGNPGNRAAYNSAYDQFESDGDEAAARRSIGQTFGAGEISSVQVDGKYVNYNEYYGSSWKEP